MKMKMSQSVVQLPNESQNLFIPVQSGAITVLF
jgi:hypothetical protein